VQITYPVDLERLDVHNQFLLPAGDTAGKHKTIETIDIMLQSVPSSRGVAALPRWLVHEYAGKIDGVPVKLGCHGIAKQILSGRVRGRRR